MVLALAGFAAGVWRKLQIVLALLVRGYEWERVEGQDHGQTTQHLRGGSKGGKGRKEENVQKGARANLTQPKSSPASSHLPIIQAQLNSTHRCLLSFFFS